MNNFAVISAAQCLAEFPGRAAQHLGQFGRGVVDQSAGDHRAVARHHFHGVAGFEVAVDGGDAGRQQ